jgi:signal transduction histidine kinase
MSQRRGPSRRAADASLLLVLLAALTLSGVLAYQAQDAVRSHRRTAEAALRDYAAFASWELGRALESGVSGMVGAAMFRARIPVELAPWGGDAGNGADPLESFAAAVDAELGACRCPEATHDFFELDLGSGEVRLLQERLGPDFRRWLVDSLPVEGLPPPERLEIRSRARSGQQPVIVTRQRGSDATRSAGPERVYATAALPGDPSVSIVYAVIHGRPGSAGRVYGFALHLPALAVHVTRQAVATTPLLPPVVTAGAANEEVLTLAVTAPGGETLYGPAEWHPDVAAVIDTVQAIGAFVTRVAVRPELAHRLVIGGLPRSRLPLLLGAFGLTLGLLAVAALQLRRQRELIRLRGEFISGVSHELRTPLAQIRLFSELLESDRLRPDQRSRSLRIISQEARRLTYLVENVLRFSRSERESDRITPQPTEVAPLVREIVEAFAPLAEPRGVGVEVRLQEGVIAPLDRDAIRQVLLNLLDNAVKYGPRGQTIQVEMDAQAGALRIRVDDAGPGIPAADRERVLEPYRRLTRDVDSATGGSGIGLAVVRELVELHGGEVSIGESPGGGVRVLLTLPIGRHASPVGPEGASSRPVPEEASRG